MAIRDISRWSPEQKARFRERQSDPMKRRADQEWEMAGLARQDGDMAAAARHTERARALERGEEVD
jgi:hypothetical protein